MAEDRIGRPFRVDLHDVAELDIRALPDRPPAGSGVESRRSSRVIALFGSFTLMSIGFRPSPRWEKPTFTPPTSAPIVS